MNTEDSMRYLSYGSDDNGNAECMKDMYGKEILYSHKLGTSGWFHYTGMHWQDISDAVPTELATKTLITRGHLALEAKESNIVRKCIPDKNNIYACRDLFEKKVTIEDVEMLDRDVHLLNCLNGTIDLRTGVLLPHDPQRYITYVSPIKYNPQADMSLWLQQLRETVVVSKDDLTPDIEQIEYLQRCTGYSLTGSIQENKLFYVYGPPRGGKGTFSETMLHILPSPIGCSKNFSTFTRKREGNDQNFDLAPLRPSRLVIASEGNKSYRLNGEIVKGLTGGDQVSACFKHKTDFNYWPKFKIWLLSNWPVNGDPDDTALWGRLQVFSFPVSYLGKEDVKRKEALLKPENLEGVLRWAVEGAVKWYQEGRLTPPNRIIVTTQEHRDKLDGIKKWLAVDNDYLDTNGFTPSSDNPYAKYSAWCEETGTYKESSRTFYETLRSRFNVVPDNIRISGKMTRGYRGLNLHKGKKQTAEVHSQNGASTNGFNLDDAELEALSKL